MSYHRHATHARDQNNRVHQRRSIMIEFSRRAALKASAGTSLLAAFGFVGSASAQPIGPEDILTVMQDDGRFSTWLAMISAAGLDRYATGRNAYTSFAPTNEALSKYPYIVRDLLYGTSRQGPNAPSPMPETGRIARVIRSHATGGVHPVAEFVGKKTVLTSVAGSQIDVDGTGGGNLLTVTLHVGSTLNTAKASIEVLTAPNVIVYPLDSFSLESFMG
jgi:uncharacterized surface protein with fasciclin (FAS1) repeats